MSKKVNVKFSSIADTKLFSVLRQFKAYELNRLKKFVDSPYFNRNEELSRLLAIIDGIIRKGEGDVVSREHVWTEVTGISRYSDLKFRKLCSDLLKLTERFLMQEMFEENTLQKADNLLVAVYNRKVEALYNSALRSATRLSEQYYFRPASYYYYEYSYERNYYNLSGLELDRSKQANIDQIAANLDKFYVAEKLRSYITMIDRQKTSAHQYELLFMDEIFSYVESGNLRDIVPINLYYQIHLLNKEPGDPRNFETLKGLLQENLQKLPKLEAFEILDSALNYCISRINSGDNHYLREYMEMSLVGIRNELLLVNGALSPWIFRNIVVAGLRLGDFTWAESFIRDYQHQIDERYRENAVSFNLANLYFYKRDYAQVLRLLQTVEYEDPTYNLNSKAMLIATYYETDEIEPLLSLLGAFNNYLIRHKSIPADRRKHYQNLIKFTRALISLPPGDVAAAQKLRGRVAATDGVVSKSWLLEKIDELL